MYSKERRPHKFIWPLQAMPLARAIALIYAILIGYVSLNPFDFDFQNGVMGIAWLEAPLPRFITVFDVLVNVLAYIPLGFLIVFSTFPRWRNFAALGIALCFSAILAGTVETLQTWLPTRIPSQMDWWANILGGLIGALFAIPLGPQWLSGSVLRRQFDKWFGLNWIACILFLLFPWAQIYPQSSWLGMGIWGHTFFSSVDWGTTVVNQVLQEAVITALCWFGTGLLLSLGMRPKSPQWHLLLSLLGFTVLIKMIFTALQFGADFYASWLTAGAVWGMLIGTFGLFLALKWGFYIRYCLAVFCLICTTIAVNFLPENPYFVLTLRAWYQGRLLHFNDLMQWVSVVWLPMALLWVANNRPGKEVGHQSPLISKKSKSNS